MVTAQVLDCRERTRSHVPNCVCADAGAFIKMNNNAGRTWTAEEHGGQTLYYQVADAFSHWTHERTMREHEGTDEGLMVCDIQGVCDATGFKYTDPAIHSSKAHGARYGRTDRGHRGIERFYRTHECNEVCACQGADSRAAADFGAWPLPSNRLAYAFGPLEARLPSPILRFQVCLRLKLPRRNHKEVRSMHLSQRRRESSGDRNRSSSLTSLSRCNSNTSEVTIEKTRHLRARMRERSVNTSLLQRTRKHGGRWRQSNGTMLFRGGGANYVTDRSGRVGITCFPDSGRQPKRRRLSEDRLPWHSQGQRRGSAHVMAPPPPRRKQQTAQAAPVAAAPDAGDDRAAQRIHLAHASHQRRCAVCGDVGYSSKLIRCDKHACSFHLFCSAACPKCR